LTVSDTTVRTQILQGLLNEVKKDDDIELIPKDMYKSYTQYRTKNRTQLKIKEEHKEEPRDKTQARKKTKVICLDSDDDSETIDYDEEVIIIEKNIASLNRKKQRLATARELHNEFDKRCEEFADVQSKKPKEDEWRTKFFGQEDETEEWERSVLFPPKKTTVNFMLN